MSALEETEWVPHLSPANLKVFGGKLLRIHQLCMVNPTIVRKYLTTKVHRDHQELKHDVAGHLNHSVWIAEEYDLVGRRKQAASIR